MILTLEDTRSSSPFVRWRYNQLKLTGDAIQTEDFESLLVKAKGPPGEQAGHYFVLLLTLYKIFECSAMAIKGDFFMSSASYNIDQSFIYGAAAI